MTAIALSAVAPDQEALLAKLQSKLGVTPAWRDLLTAGTGQILTDFAATVGAYDQNSIQRAWEETFPDLAKIPSSVVWITRMFGTHVQRRDPAATTVGLSRSAPLLDQTIPSYTLWKVAGADYYNRAPLVFANLQTTAAVVLYEGTPSQQTFTGDGSELQQLIAGVDAPSLADADLRVTVDGKPWQVVRDGLWLYKATDAVVYENTLPDGNVLLQFGDGYYGAIPPNGSQIVVSFVVTSGSAANGLASSSPVVLPKQTGITGLTSAATASGAEAKSATFYKRFGPALYAAGPAELMVRREDHVAVMATYPGVLDARAFGQQETHPNDFRWMMAVTVVLITDHPWSDSEWASFEAWYAARAFFNLRLVRHDPAQVDVIVEYEVRVFPGIDTEQTERDLLDLTQAFFTPRPGSLGWGLILSDLDDMVKEYSNSANEAALRADGESAAVDYYIRRSPRYNVSIARDQYLVNSRATFNVLPTSRARRQ